MKIGEKNAYFFPNWLKIYKIAQKKAEIFYIYVFNLHPCSNQDPESGLWNRKTRKLKKKKKKFNIYLITSVRGPGVLYKKI